MFGPNLSWKDQRAGRHLPSMQTSMRNADSDLGPGYERDPESEKKVSWPLVFVLLVVVLAAVLSLLGVEFPF